MIDLYFTEQKLAIEVDEKRHTDRSKTRDEEREKNLKYQHGCKIIRINPDAEDYNIFLEISKKHNHIVNQPKHLY